MFLLLLTTGTVFYFAEDVHTAVLDVMRPVMSFFTNTGYVIHDVGDTIWNGSGRAEEIRQLRIRNRALEAERA